MQQCVTSPVERLAESDPAWVSVVDIKIRLEEFFSFGCVRRNCEIFPVDLGCRTGRAFTDSGAKVAAITHH